ncbi:hypothetical protein G6L11_01975 [Agrobacterium tumefaciens]|nr:hypothetical protein [Agrobacterium tumefaciens]NTA68226.1 hypothetical protein [Agrobacterium tumefaciens]
MNHPVPDPRPLYLLSNRDCRFPLTSPEPNEPHLFCGSPSIDGKPYRAARCALAYLPGDKSQ